MGGKFHVVGEHFGPLAPPALVTRDPCSIRIKIEVEVPAARRSEASQPAEGEAKRSDATDGASRFPRRLEEVDRSSGAADGAAPRTAGASAGAGARALRRLAGHVRH